MLSGRSMGICETTVRPMDGAVEHPGRDLLRVGEQAPWQDCVSGYQLTNMRGQCKLIWLP